MRSALALLAMTGIAHAGDDEVFAKAFGATRAHDVARFELPAGNQATHVMVGRFDAGKTAMTGALVMTCKDACTWQRTEFGIADAVEVAGIVDLQGAPAAIPITGVRGTKVRGARSMKFPVIAIVTREAGGKRRKLYLISLVEADRGSLVLMETIEEAGSYRRSFRLATGETKGVLDLVALERRRGCDDGELVYALEEHHFRTKKVTPGKCSGQP